ncbi:flagellar hook-length control protein [Streptomyces jumonjinensis]|uniref:Flagellar hook-length control protein n=1 Tax=Streptomyces jumonjinensis TaxID=1945 RepID=A0A646KMQ3_STRJU|nr:flagellar hook-length control protein [Streptomyces jumonjinensis]MQT03327.1 flagellar hook-length control protein [Streptomyces jumonjinensis]
MHRFTSGLALCAAVVAALATTAAPASAAPPAPAAATAMTWTLLGDGPSGTVRVGGGPLSNPYTGDTPTTASLPLLCLKITGSPVPAGITPDFYAGWARGQVAATSPIRGNRLTSRALADGVCANSLGAGWRMAEFHDGRYGPALEHSGGWSYWAYGDVPLGTRFWTAINDQPTNPWS